MAASDVDAILGLVYPSLDHTYIYQLLYAIHSTKGQIVLKQSTEFS